jgi:protein-S-isoprenylcysteine O-methyltransferase Ste14
MAYASCRFSFPVERPAIFFTHRLRFIIGEEPLKLIRSGLYEFSRNPMYAGVILAVLGQALIFASPGVAVYGAILWLCFHLVIVCLEEPHLRRRYGLSYQEYCRHVPRWLGWPE